MATKETQRLRALAGKLAGSSVSEKRKTVSAKKRRGDDAPETPPAPAEAHAPHGERGDFLKLTVTLSPEAYELVLDEMRRRKLARLPNAALSAILREAVVQYLPRRE